MFRNTNTAKISSNNNKPYCRACHNAGMSLEEYTNHWTRSSPGSGGVITCPLILASECGYCHNTGHWTKFCPVLMADDKAKAKASAAEVVVAAATKPVVTVISVRNNKNYFSALNEDEDSEDEEETVATAVVAVSASAVPVVTQSKVLDWKKALGMLDLKKGENEDSSNGLGGIGERMKKVINWKSALSMKAEFPPLVVGTEDCGGCVAVDLVKKTSTETWASILAKPKPITTPIMTVAVAPVICADEEVNKPTFSFSTFKFTNWADAVSDDEDE